jgi:hypothetical protein
MVEQRCDRAPAGWMCSRAACHEGPCAAYPVSNREGLPPVTEADMKAMQSVIDQLFTNKRKQRTSNPLRRFTNTVRLGLDGPYDCLEESPDGEFVEYADVQAEIARLRAALETLASMTTSQPIAARFASEALRTPVETSALRPTHRHQWLPIGARCGPMVEYVCPCGAGIYDPAWPRASEETPAIPGGVQQMLDIKKMADKL